MARRRMPWEASEGFLSLLSIESPFLSIMHANDAISLCSGAQRLDDAGGVQKGKGALN
jgi:hypothetical protein